MSLLEKVNEAPKQEYKYTIDQIERLRLVNMLINRNNRLSNAKNISKQNVLKIAKHEAFEKELNMEIENKKLKMLLIF